MCDAVQGGADSWVGVEEAWFRQFLKLEHSILSHDTFGDVFAKIDREAFQKRFMQWVERVFRVTKGQVVAIDGTTCCG